MKSFTRLTGLVAPLDRSNVDTDAILPKQFLKSIKRTGFGVNLFDEWRYLDQGESGQDGSKRPLNPDFVLNQARYQGAQILLARDNFGCGSSREHAPWALEEYGFRVIIAPSFAEIFFGNCLKNGLLPVVLDAGTIDELFKNVSENLGYRLSVDLSTQTVRTPENAEHAFQLDAFRKDCLLNGLDEIALTLQRSDRIREYEQARMQTEPWIYGGL